MPLDAHPQDPTKLSPSASPPWFYRAARLVVKAALYVFYKRIQVWGREHIPESGPVVFAANHPNASVDPLLIAAFPHRVVHYCARAPLFDRLITGFFLRQTGAIPLYRKRDDPSQMARNLESFERCYEVLARGEALGIFPEGVSYTGLKLEPVKTGTARIVLEAQARYVPQGGIGVRIVPVGLNFRDGYAFRGEVFVLFGEPIDASPYFSLYRERPHEAVRDLTDVIRQRLEALTVNVRETTEESFLRDLDEVYTELDSPSESLRDDFQRQKYLLDACSYFEHRDPVEARELRRLIRQYARLVRVAGVRSRTVGHAQRTRELLGVVGRQGLRLLAFLPLAAWGAANNYVPYLLPRWFARRLTSDVLQWARLKMTLGLLVFAVFYAAESYVVARWWGALAAVVYAVSLAPAGFFTLRYGEWLAEFWASFRALALLFGRRNLLRELARRRQYLLERLEDCRQRYLENRAIIPEEQQVL